MKLVNALKLLLSKKAFLKTELENVQMKVDAGEAWAPVDELRPQALERIEKKRKGLFISFVIVLSLVVGGVLTASAINTYCPLSLFSIRVFRAVSVVIVAWAVLSRIGYESPTMNGETILEITSEYSFKLYYGLGVYLATVALFLEPI